MRPSCACVWGALVLALVVAPQPALSGGFDPAAYKHTSSLGGTGPVRLYWNVDEVAGSIAFALSAPTTGWVALGLSPNGGMRGSDIVMGWADADGTAHVSDRFAAKMDVPTVDADQSSLSKTGVQEEGGWTTLWFTRPIVSCDDHDRDVPSGTARIVWAFNPADPEPGKNPSYHSANRGGRSLLLRGQLPAEPPVPASAKSVVLTAGVNGVDVKATGTDSAATTYWCSSHALPATPSKAHIIRIDPVIQPENVGRVHHILLYDCGELSDASHVGVSDACYTGNMPSSLRGCNGGKVLMGWAVGGGSNVYPAEAGYPMGGTGGMRHVLMETHYDNPAQVPFSDKSGLNITYTTELRANDAAVINVGQYVSPNVLAIPRCSPAFTAIGSCPSACTSKWPSDLHVVAVMLHLHTAGRAISLRHIRGGAELPPLSVDPGYDFNFQSFQYMDSDVIVKKGDSLLTTCVYDTTKRAGITYAGLASMEEMCYAYLMVWPAPPDANCKSLTRDTAKQTEAPCDSALVTLCGGSSVTVPSTELPGGFTPYGVQRCSATEHPGIMTFANATSAPKCDVAGGYAAKLAADGPVCAASAGASSGTSLDGAQSQGCAKDFCQAVIDDCKAKAACNTQLTCLVSKCGGDADGCPACPDISLLAPLVTCVTSYCDGGRQCLPCIGCSACYSNDAATGCLGKPATGSCAACATDECKAGQCAGCFSHVIEKAALAQCTQDQCTQQHTDCTSAGNAAAVSLCAAALTCFETCYSVGRQAHACAATCAEPFADGGTAAKQEALAMYNAVGSCIATKGCVTEARASDFGGAQCGLDAAGSDACLEYPMSARLTPALVLRWRVGDASSSLTGDARTVHFRAELNSSTWLAVGASARGLMVAQGSDAATVATIGKAGAAREVDRVLEYVINERVESGITPVSKQVLVPSASRLVQANGATILEFSRPLDASSTSGAGLSQYTAVKGASTHVVYAYGADGDNTFGFHKGGYGSAALFLGGSACDAATTCFGKGSCRAGGAGGCECNRGYAGAACDACASNFVRDAARGICETGAAVVSLRLDMPFSSVGAEGSAERHSFELKLRQDIAGATGISVKRVEVVSLKEGSVIAQVRILSEAAANGGAASSGGSGAGGGTPEPTVAQVLDSLSAQLSTPSSALLQGAVTSKAVQGQTLAPQYTAAHVAGLPADAKSVRLDGKLTMKWHVPDAAAGKAVTPDSLVDVELELVGAGWLAVGVQPDGRMVGADAVIGGVDSGGSASVSGTGAYQVEGKSATGFKAGDAAAVAALKSSSFTREGGVGKLRFTRTFKGSRAMATAGPTRLVWAYGATGAWVKHTARGSAAVDLSTGEADTHSHDHVEGTMIVHIVCMVLAWVVLLPAGAFVARFCRHREPRTGHGAWWFVRHRGVQCAGLLVAVLGLCMAVSHIAGEGDAHFNTPHKALGLVVVLMAILQPLNAAVRPPPGAGAGRRRWQLLHKGLGYAALAFGFVNVLLGMAAAEFGVAVQAVYGVAVVAFVGTWAWLAMRGDDATAYQLGPEDVELTGVAGTADVSGSTETRGTAVRGGGAEIVNPVAASSVAAGTGAKLGSGV